MGDHIEEDFASNFFASGDRLSLSNVLRSLRHRRAEFRGRLALRGAILLRGIGVSTLADFEDLASTVITDTMRYQGGDARRTSISQVVYTANDSPGARTISVHNELGYSNTSPEIVMFCCLHPAQKGGETTLVDGRSLLSRCDEDFVRMCRSDKMIYVQNLPAVRDTGVQGAKTWQETFEVGDKRDVERILRDRGARWEWRTGDALHVEEAVSSIAVSSYTGEEAMFCQADRWDASQIDGEDRPLVEMIPPDDRYHHVRFDASGPLRVDHLRKLGASKRELQFAVHMAEGDVLCIDNKLVLHGRLPFEGVRKMYVAMGRF